MTKPADVESSFRYTGWKVTLAAFVGVMVSFAAIVPYTFSLFLKPLHDSFSWKIEAISRAFAIAALTVAACSPTIGTLLDRLPPRRVILPSIVVFGCGVASLALLRGRIVQFYAVYFLLGIVGNGTAQLAYSRAVLTWFERRRGLAIAVVLTGSATGSILLPILTQTVLAAYGWRASYAVLGLCALLGFPLTALLVRNRPAPQTEAQPLGFTKGLGAVLRARVFWLVALPVMLAAFSANAAIAHLAALLAGRGVSSGSAALALSMLGFSSIAGRLATGYLLDRIFAPLVSIAVFLLSGAGVLMLAFAHTASAGLLGAFLLGFGGGSEADVVPYLIARYFGRARFSTLYGFTSTAYAVGGAVGPVLMGRSFDHAGGYVPVRVAVFALPCLAAACLQLAIPAYPEARQEAALPPELLAGAPQNAL